MKEHYFASIYPFMFELNLTKEELAIYAIIYGFSKNCGGFLLNFNYLSNFLNISVDDIIEHLNTLITEKEYIRVLNFEPSNDNEVYVLYCD